MVHLRKDGFQVKLLGKLHSSFKIATFRKTSSEEEIAALDKYTSISLPVEFVGIVRENTEIEILVANEKCIRIWGASGCIEMNEAYAIQKYIPFSLAIGDDECGNAIIYANGKSGFGVYMVALNDLDVEELMYIAPTLESFLVYGEGVSAVLS